MDDAIDRLQRFVDGDEAATDAIRDGLLRWLRHGDGLPLASFFGLPDRRPRSVRIALRDAWLREAATLLDLPDARPWERARMLKAALAAFTAFRWPAWKRLDGPPAERCTRFEAAAWYALHEHDDLPASIQAYVNILQAKQEAELTWDFMVKTRPIRSPKRRDKMMTMEQPNRPPVRVRALRAFFIDRERVAEVGEEVELDHDTAMSAIGAGKAAPAYTARKEK